MNIEASLPETQREFAEILVSRYGYGQSESQLISKLYLVHEIHRGWTPSVFYPYFTVSNFDQLLSDCASIALSGRHDDAVAILADVWSSERRVHAADHCALVKPTKCRQLFWKS